MPLVSAGARNKELTPNCQPATCHTHAAWAKHFKRSAKTSPLPWFFINLTTPDNPSFDPFLLNPVRTLLPHIWLDVFLVYIAACVIHMLISVCLWLSHIIKDTANPSSPLFFSFFFCLPDAKSGWLWCLFTQAGIVEEHNVVVFWGMKAGHCCGLLHESHFLCDIKRVIPLCTGINGILAEGGGGKEEGRWTGRTTTAQLLEEDILNFSPILEIILI